MNRRCPAAGKRTDLDLFTIFPNKNDSSDSKTIGQVIQALQISEATYNRWRNGHRRASGGRGGMKAEERAPPRSGGRRLKELEQENGRLKKLVADLTLDKDILKEALEGNW